MTALPVALARTLLPTVLPSRARVRTMLCRHRERDLRPYGWDLAQCERCDHLVYYPGSTATVLGHKLTNPGRMVKQPRADRRASAQSRA